MDGAFFLDYVILNELDNNKTYKKDQINRYALKKLMEDFIANNRNHSMKEFITNIDLISSIKNNLKDAEKQFDNQKIFD